MTEYQIDLYLEDRFFVDNQENCPISEKQWEDYFTQWLNGLNLDLSPDKTYEISLILTDDREIKTLNNEYRDKNQATDVLSFAALETDFPDTDFLDTICLGDIIISVETAQKQGNLQKHSLAIELAWLASHGFLHLLGWDHPDDDTLKEMLTIQQTLLHRVNLTPPSIEDY